MTCAPSHNIPNRVGRPRTVSPPPEELEALGVEMVEWFIVHPDALHISEWYSLVKFFTDNAWETMVLRPEFVGYYEQAKKIIGKKYLDKTSNVREGVSQRWQRVYFKDLKKEEDEDAKFKAQLANQDDKRVSPKEVEESLKDELMLLRAEFAAYKENNARVE